MDLQKNDDDDYETDSELEYKILKSKLKKSQKKEIVEVKPRKEPIVEIKPITTKQQLKEEKQ